MGVPKLWDLVQECGEKVDLETLQDKVLAIDASIWIHTFISSLKDGRGDPTPHAHLVGFFWRILKLLTFKVRPIFVFDGAVPYLKQRTIDERRKRREKTQASIEKNSRKVLLLKTLKAQLESLDRKELLGDLTLNSNAFSIDDDDFEFDFGDDDLEIININDNDSNNNNNNNNNNIDDNEGDEAVTSEPIDIDGNDNNDSGNNDSIDLEDEELIQQQKQILNSIIIDRNKINNNNNYNNNNNQPINIDNENQNDDDDQNNTSSRQQLITKFVEHHRILQQTFSTRTIDGESFNELPKDIQLEVLSQLKAEKKIQDKIKVLNSTQKSPNDFSNLQLGSLLEKGKITRKMYNIYDSMQEEIQTASDGSSFVFHRNNNNNNNNSSSQQLTPFKSIASPNSPTTSTTSTTTTTISPQSSLSDRILLSQQKNNNKAFSTPISYSSSSKKKGKSPSDTPYKVGSAHHATISPSPHYSSLEALINRKALSSATPTPTKTINVSGGPDDTQLLIGGIRTSSDNSNKNLFNSFIDQKSDDIEDGAPVDMDQNIQSVIDDADDDDDLDFGNNNNNVDYDYSIDDIELPTPKQNDMVESNTPTITNPFIKKNNNNSNLSSNSTTNNSLSIKPIASTTKTPTTDTSSSTSTPDKKTTTSTISTISTTSTKPKYNSIIDDLEDDIIEPPKDIFDIEEEENYVLGKNNKRPTDMDTPAVLMECPVCFKKFPEKELESHVLAELEQQKIEDTIDENAQPNIFDDFDTLTDNQQVQNILENEPIGHDDSNQVEIELEEDLKDTDSKEPKKTTGFDHLDIFDVQEAEEEEEEEKTNEMIVSKTNGDNNGDDNNTSTAITIPVLEKFTSSEREMMEQELELEKVAVTQKITNQIRNVQSITDDILKECHELLAMFGIPFITSPTEAESQCAELFNLGFVDGVVTDDSDILLFANRPDMVIYRNLFQHDPQKYMTKDIERLMGLKRQDLISLALLLGCDYTQGVHGIGLVNAMEILAEFKNLEEFKKYMCGLDGSKPKDHPNFMSMINKITLSSTFPSDQVIQAFINPEVNRSREPFTWNHPDIEALRVLTVEKFGWSNERIDFVLNPILRVLMSDESSKIATANSWNSRFFIPLNQQQPRDGRKVRQLKPKFKSKRLTTAIDKIKRRLKSDQRKEEIDKEKEKDKEEKEKDEEEKDKDKDKDSTSKKQKDQGKKIKQQNKKTTPKKKRDDRHGIEDQEKEAVEGDDEPKGGEKRKKKSKI